MRRSALLTALSLIITACSGGSDEAKPAAAEAESAPSTAQAGNACTLVSDAEMAEALGVPVTGKSETSNGHCIFRTGNPLVYADIEMDRENADAAWQGINAGDSAIGAQQEALAGIGDKAFFGPRDRLYVRKGNAFVAVEAGFDDKVRERATRVARLIAGKL